MEKYLIEKGFIFPTNSIYGGQEASWDYGHIGVLLKENLKQAWISFFVSSRENARLYEGTLLTSRQIWEASGHLSHFEKKLVECKKCNHRYELEDNEDLKACRNCNARDLTEPQSFQLLFKTDKYYLRPETAQTIFVNTKLISLKSQLSLPFGIAQIGKAFRNEVSPGRGVFRTKEFEQLEFEEFVLPEKSNATLEHQKKQVNSFLVDVLGFSTSSIQFQEVTGSELPHYSLRNADLYYNFEFGREELWGIANRGDFDLDSHQKCSGVKLHFQTQENAELVLPHVVEHSVGLNRLLLALITEKLTKKEGREWAVLSLPINLSPYKFAILPLAKMQHGEALNLFNWLKKSSCSIALSTKGSIGKRYREQDEIGTAFCLTIDYQSGNWADDEFSFTLRERDTGQQLRLKRENLKKYIWDCLAIHPEFR
ncbi:glycyl-tRNA synthetase [Candidatus Mycoplasma haemominutum 'Birmingham 1']|uniref:Glycyl-tRNA synthetase n=1 Tax=Candidatus Mycoplasma haematominutum 'Birmingham 1' TaxID=1116213 RepID=G8C3V5_9MOLU|nr:glycyl-tRNA synthetase [Candidatus Mycoplasma haematominutum 'Birmingham 1']